MKNILVYILFLAILLTVFICTGQPVDTCKQHLRYIPNNKFREHATYIVLKDGQGKPFDISDPMTKREFYDVLNAIRMSSGSTPLKKSVRLEVKAGAWLTFLDRHDLGMVHDTDTEDGEVLTNAYQYLTWWLNSPRHKQVLLGRRWKRIGIAEKNGVWCARLN